ncbi:hypothetical protein D8674_040932 [Pyrus ussuriensis x Pyrus communis]|uniref:Uncharacterized protein n=1 Tax=Pyrus ussuriensis x Pyrus communis TaxID=2448454 RepID=A0A5N5H0Q5_9ROSA|nr:hypothetical protein D8674_040932 [Pyrus ussuriensis x Pyrus communis]
MTDNNPNDRLMSVDNSFGKFPDHLVIEIFIRVPVSKWAQISCENSWQATLAMTFPLASQAKRWPRPIPRGLSKRNFRERFEALYVSKHIFSLDGEIDEIVGHSYLFLKEQLECSTMPPSSSILHETLIDQFIACGKSKVMAHDLVSQIWLAVLDNLEENEKTFQLLKHNNCRNAEDTDMIKFILLLQRVFLPYPYSRLIKVQWRVFEKLFTDFRDCFNYADYYDVLGCAKNKFQPIPSTWLAY